MVTLFITIFGMTTLIWAIIWAYEIKHAKVIDNKEPFLWDDYEE